MGAGALDDSRQQRRQHRMLVRRGGFRWPLRVHGDNWLRWGGSPDLQRVSPNRFGDVLELRRTKIRDRKIEPRFDLPIGVLGKTNRAGLGDPLQPRRDIDAVAHQVAVALFDHVAEMNAYAEIDAAVARQTRIALDHRILHFDRAAQSIDHAAKLDENAVAGALDHAPVMHGDGGIDEVAAQRPEPRQRAVFVHAGEPAIPDHVGRQDRGEFPDFAHWASPPQARLTQGTASDAAPGRQPQAIRRTSPLGRNAPVAGHPPSARGLVRVELCRPTRDRPMSCFHSR
jgi:hypothetical protein